MVENRYRRYQFGCIYNGAPHTEQQLSEENCKILMKKHKAWFVRNVYNWDCPEPTSFWYIIQDRPIRLEELHSKCRNQVRRSLKELNIIKIQRDFLGYDELYDVYVSAFSRYKIKTSVPMPKEDWIRHIRDTRNNVEIWGAYEKETGQLIAYAEVLIQSNAAKYTALKAIPEKMNKTYPFYGLLFEMNRYYIEEKRLLYVTDGARSITEHSNIQPFLEKFNFRKAYCQLRVTYIWWMKIIVKLLYPIRRLFGNSKIGYLLRFEAINRNEF